MLKTKTVLSLTVQAEKIFVNNSCLETAQVSANFITSRSRPGVIESHNVHCFQLVTGSIIKTGGLKINLDLQR